MKKYIVVSDWCPSALENEVIEHINKGYRALGSLMCDPQRGQCLQAMVKVETEKKARKKLIQIIRKNCIEEDMRISVEELVDEILKYYKRISK